MKITFLLLFSPLLFNLSTALINFNPNLNNNNKIEVINNHFTNTNCLIIIINNINKDFKEFFTKLKNVPKIILGKNGSKLLEKNHPCAGYNSKGFIFFISRTISEVLINKKDFFTQNENENFWFDFDENYDVNSLEEIWQQHKILHTVATFDDRYYIYDPFSKDSTGNYGRNHVFTQDNILENVDILKKSLKNLNGYILDIGAFPTSLAHPLYSNGRITDFKEVDGNLLNLLEAQINFKKNLKIPTDLTYGFKQQNGSFNGALKLLTGHEIDFISIEYFIKDYFTPDIDFTPVSLEDNVCVVKNKAKTIPQWQLLYFTFHKNIWISIILTYILAGLSLRMIQRTLLRLGKNYKPSRYVFNDTFQILLTLSLARVPKVLSERVFFSACFVMSMTLIGVFQGSLVTVLSTPLYEKEINTLKDLAGSSLVILTEYAWVADDVFTDDFNPVISTLKSRVRVVRLDRDVDEVLGEGVASLTVDINKRSRFYAKGSDVVHVVKECVINYNMAYPVRTRSVFGGRIKEVVGRVAQGGLFFKWYDDMLASNRGRARKVLGSEEKKKFSVLDLQLVFWELGLGCLVGVLVFLGEVVLYRSRSN